MTFEYQKYPPQNIPLQRSSLEPILLDIWRARSFLYASDFEAEPLEITEASDYQPFFRFDGECIYAKNFVGFVQLEKHLLEIYPKVFKDKGVDKGLMLKHIFFWFRYCRKILFPYAQSNLDSLPETDIPELLIWLFASKCLEVINQNPYHQYQETAEVLATPRGKIDFQAYARNGLARGLYHQIDCVYEPFVYDNQVNRTIKYVCRLLQSVARFGETQEVLRKIVFTLDDVDDLPCSASSLQSVRLNAFFSDYEPILDWCRRFLDQHLYSHRPYELSTWSLLLPMEYVFEDFVAGFIELELPEWKVHPQKSDLHLTDTPKAFQMRHDIFLEHRENTNNRIIVDTKYKMRPVDPEDKKKGVSQADLYQVFSYAVRRKCPRVVLIYPNFQEEVRPPEHFEINVDWLEGGKITIMILEIPFWSGRNFGGLQEQLREGLREVLQ